MKKAIKVILLALLSIIIIIAAACGIYFGTYQATVSFDLAEKTGEVKKGASGYLYGIAENGVPSAEMVESVDVKTIAQKVSGGLQHPVGDIDRADKMLKSADYEVVYLQDVYDTWYYLNDEIMTKRSEGTYNPQELLDSDYLPKVERTVKAMLKNKYSAPIVYCLYNECDNGVWFGETQKDENPDNKYGVWCDYNDKAKDTFNSAWKQTYELVRSLDDKALIGGPGFCDFDSYELEYFLNFCKENGCLPDIMIYHELAEHEAYYFDEHIREYRALEQKLGIEPLEIIITEYGMMSENGYLGEMVKYVTQFENNKVYGDTAYWRLADNLNDTCADDNSPNAEWWLMRWYTDMKGETVKGTNKDLLSSDFKNYFKYHYDELSFTGFMGIASTDGDEIDVVCGGGDRKSRVQLKHLDKTSLYGKEVEVTVEETVYKGLYGIVNRPVFVDSYTKKLGKSLTVELGKLDSANAYHIVIKKASGNEKTPDERPVRYEFENGTLIGNTYTYDSYCPASGKNDEGNDMVGGMEKLGDGVEITVNTGGGDYQLDFVYGNSNDGEFGENGRQNPDDRVNTSVKLTIDGKEQVLELPNTIKSEYTSCYTLTHSFTEGEHTIRVEHMEGTYVLDSLVVSPFENSSYAYVLEDADRTTDGIKSFLAIAPSDGYYMLKTDAESAVIDGAEIKLFNGTAAAYLKRGLNYVDVISDKGVTLVADKINYENTPVEQLIVKSDALKLYSTAALEGGYVDNISSNGGAAELSYTASKSGKYRITLEYSNNDEGGVHDYNVDLIERYVTVSVNSSEQGSFYCRNTYSWQTVKTVTFTVELKQGENKIRLTNNGRERFNHNTTYAPHIYSVTVSPPQL